MRNWIIVLFLLESCATAPPPTSATRELAAIKATVMSSDYRGDIQELARLRDELSRWPADKEPVYLAHYWKGFASWRMAINGANHGMKSDELMSNLKDAATEFYVSIRLKGDFADAYAAAALVNSWLATFYVRSGSGSDAVTANADVRERASLSFALLARAAALDPHNPRVLGAQAAFLLFRPGPQKETIARAIEVYRQMLAEADRRGTDAASPFPDWGKPEALMSLAYAHMRQTPPDLPAAREEASAALRLEPEWSYVRDILLPQIEKSVVK